MRSEVKRPWANETLTGGAREREKTKWKDSWTDIGFYDNIFEHYGLCVRMCYVYIASCSSNINTGRLGIVVRHSNFVIEPEELVRGRILFDCSSLPDTST